MSTAFGIEQLRSTRSLARLLAQRGAQVVVVVLIIAIGLDSALILTRALGGSGLPPAPSVGALPFSPRSHNPQLTLATIINGHLFGAAATMGVSDAPPTTMPLVLTGVIADKDPSRGQAIIGANAANAKLYKVGAAISGGAHLHAVYSDRVLLERDGHLETLMLPRTLLAGTAGYVPPSPTTGRAGIRAANASVLAGLVRVQPVFSQGKLSGYRIFPGPRGARAFSQLGLRPGDLVLAINGTSLDDPTQALQVLQTLSSSGSATVTVSRNGTPQEVNLNLAEVSSEEQTGEGPTSNVSHGTVAPRSLPPIRRRRFGLPASGQAE